MSAGHAVAHLVHDGGSAVHRLPAATKVAVTLVFVVAVVATPRGAGWAHAAHLALVALAVAAARLPVPLVLRRLRVELPFLAFAVLLPVVGQAPRIDVLGVSLSEPGLAAAGDIAAKATLGVLAAVVLAATTPVPDLLGGLRRLRVPALPVAIAGFMVRYLDVVVGEASRTRIARLSRGDDPRWLWQARALASSTGTLFVRAYERGERVHLAMLSRGYDGTMPPLGRGRGAPSSPLATLVAVGAALVAVAVAVAARR